MSHLLELEDLKVFFDTSNGVAKAVDGVSYSIDSGRALGVVGESGCGKTVSALSILRLTPKPGRIAGGKIIFEEDNLLDLKENEMRKIRGNRIAMIFQEPMTSLNPVFTIGNQISEGVRLHRDVSRKEAWERSIKMLEKVGIPSPGKRVCDYPHQLSGGMRQRAMIAMALSCDPSLLIADEPTTALDVTIQSQILDLMWEMRDQYAASLILITHDLAVVAQTCDDVVVMYAGKVVESATVKALFSHPFHPYTRGLLESIPAGHGQGAGKRLKEIKGIVPALTDLPPGCPFHPRCPDVMDVCRMDKPELKVIEPGSSAACWLYSSGVASGAS